MSNPILELSTEYLMPNYARWPIVMEKGAGSIIWDNTGKSYIDLFAGFGGTGVAGHCHPTITKAITEQAQRLTCHGNLFSNQPQAELAQLLIEKSFGKGKVFFCHSGAEADEAALKLARKAAGPGRYKVISFDGCFHGRTMGGLSLCPEVFQKDFEPMLPGNVKSPYGDLAALEQKIDSETAAIFIEAIQGEGGVNVPTQAFIKGVRELCDRHNLLMVCDEVWTAPARTGKWFAIQHFDVLPDVITSAKAIGGGLPLAVCIANEKYGEVLTAGTHGCTMGGNPLCAASALAACRLIEDQNLCQQAENLGSLVMDFFEDQKLDLVQQVRGYGLFLGLQIEARVNAADIVKACFEAGLHCCTAKNNVIRLAPALTIPETTLKDGLKILAQVLKEKGSAA